MPFIVKINTDGDKFKEPYDTRLEAVTRANAIMDAGEYIKTTRHGIDSTYIPYKVLVTRMPRGKVILIRTEIETIDVLASEALLKIKDDERMIEKGLL